MQPKALSEQRERRSVSVVKLSSNLAITREISLRDTGKTIVEAFSSDCVSSSVLNDQQCEQKRSLRNIEARQSELGSTLNLKIWILAFSIFSLIVRWLAFEAKIQLQRNDVDTFGRNRVAVTNKVMEFTMETLASSSNGAAQRHLEESKSMVCSSVARDSAESNRTVSCGVQGKISYNDAVKIYQMFCPQWKTDEIWSEGSCLGGVTELLLSCNNKVITILGGPYLPASPPFVGDGFVVFPAGTSPGETYMASQYVASPQPDAPLCEQTFSLSMWCPDPEYSLENAWSSSCYVFSVSDQTCFSELNVCGDDTPSKQ